MKENVTHRMTVRDDQISEIKNTHMFVLNRVLNICSYMYFLVAHWELIKYPSGSQIASASTAADGRFISVTNSEI